MLNIIGCLARWARLPRRDAYLAVRAAARKLMIELELNFVAAGYRLFCLFLSSAQLSRFDETSLVLSLGGAHFKRPRNVSIKGTFEKEKKTLLNASRVCLASCVFAGPKPNSIVVCHLVSFPITVGHFSPPPTPPPPFDSPVIAICLEDEPSSPFIC